MFYSFTWIHSCAKFQNTASELLTRYLVDLVYLIILKVKTVGWHSGVDPSGISGTGPTLKLNI